MIVANYVNNKNKGFNSDYNEVILIDKLGKIEKIKKNKKSFIASKIVEKITQHFISNGRHLN